MEGETKKNKGKNQKSSEVFSINLFEWEMGREELKNQVEHYNTLRWFRSARKLATALIIFSIMSTLISAMMGWFPSGVWVDIVLMLILAFFVYRGKEWAMIVTMIYWTLGKGFQVVSRLSAEDFISVRNIIISVIVWAIFMKAFWQAYQVERERRRLRKNMDSYG